MSGITQAFYNIRGTATVPNAPTVGTTTMTSGTTATVAFTQPASNGGATITSYTAISSPGNITGTINQAGSGTITVSGLSVNTTYTFTVKATNSVGQGSASSSSSSTRYNQVDYYSSISGVSVPTNTNINFYGTGGNATPAGPYYWAYYQVDSAGGLDQQSADFYGYGPPGSNGYPPFDPTYDGQNGGSTAWAVPSVDPGYPYSLGIFQYVGAHNPAAAGGDSYAYLGGTTKNFPGQPIGGSQTFTSYTVNSSSSTSFSLSISSGGLVEVSWIS